MSTQTTGNQLKRLSLRIGGADGERAIFLTLVGSIIGVIAVFAATRSQGGVAALEPVLIIAGVILAVMSVRNWEFGINAILVVVVLEGAIRKWFLPSLSELVYFYKDFLMLATLIGYARQRRKTPLAIKPRLKLISATLAIFVLYVSLAVAMPGGPHPVVGLLGLKAYCLYMPLAFITIRAFPTRERLIRLLKWYLLIVLPVAAIGMMQFLDTNQQSALNRYALMEDTAGVGAVDIAKFSTAAGSYYIRITGTFSYITGLSVYLPVVFAFLLALTSLNDKRGVVPWLKVAYYAGIGATIVTSFMTGSRSSVFSMGVAAVVFYSFTSGRQAFRRIRQIAIAGTVTYIAFANFFPDAYDAFYNRTFGEEERVTEARGRIEGQLGLPVEEASYAGLFGYGIGLTQNSVPALNKRLGISEEKNPIPIPYESEPGRVTLELGVFGFLLYTILRLVLLVTTLRLSFAIRDRDSKVLAFAATAALVVPLIAGGAITTHTQNVYQWFLVGVVLALYNAERVQIQAQRRATPHLPGVPLPPFAQRVYQPEEARG
jgi:hypothetical protein